jgi:hypothetical protein
MHRNGVSAADAFMSCPRYDLCSANDCPLDPAAALHGGPRHHEPDEEACRASRRTRERGATAHGLPAGFALLPHEREREARRARWEALPPEERVRRAAGLWRGPGPILTGLLEVVRPVRPNVARGDTRSREPVSGRVP